MFWKKKQPASGPITYDATTGVSFDTVTSVELVDQLVTDGRLVRAFIIDPIFGGSEEAVNTLPVPPQAQQHFDAITDVMADAIRAGKSVNLDVKPEYRGDSRVPASVIYDAGEAGVHIINIW